VSQLAGVITLIALAATVASLAYLHVAPTGLSPVRNAVSQYGITPFRAGYRAATIAFAVAGAALAAGLLAAIHGRGRIQVVVLLVVFAVARAVISWYPMDAPAAERTSTGRAHGWLAIAAFGAAALAALRLGGVLTQSVRWHALAPVSTTLGALMVALLLVMGLARSAPAIRRAFGGIERAFYATAIIWFTVVAVACVAAS
jgi:hypothetical protein